jgi:hypothetical protein
MKPGKATASTGVKSSLVRRWLNGQPICPPYSSNDRGGKGEGRKGKFGNVNFIDMVVTAYDCRTTIVTASDFMSVAECAKFITWGESCGFEDCNILATRDMAHRKQGRLSHLDDDGSLSASIYSRVRPLIPDSCDGMNPVGCSRNIRLYRYEAGDSFGKHIDESYSETCINDVGVTCQAKSKFTMLVYLSGVDGSGGNAVRGGSTNFYQSHSNAQPVVSVPPCTGQVLLHAHGRRCLTHEGSSVEAGNKYVLRTDVLYS